jgi:hypothetical protein
LLKSLQKFHQKALPRVEPGDVSIPESYRRSRPSHEDRPETLDIGDRYPKIIDLQAYVVDGSMRRATVRHGSFLARRFDQFDQGPSCLRHQEGDTYRLQRIMNHRAVPLGSEEGAIYRSGVTNPPYGKTVVVYRWATGDL